MEALKIDMNLEELRKISVRVNLNKDNIEKDIEVLNEYCKTHSVLAMAANQLGIFKRIVYLKNTNLNKLNDENVNEAKILINPVILSSEGLTYYWEACASCMDNMGLVLRPYRILVSYYDLDGRRHRKAFKGFPATVLSHELDHLDGILHIDKALKILVMEKEDRKKFRESHKYTILSEDGNFYELERKFLNDKDKCNEIIR